MKDKPVRFSTGIQNFATHIINRGTIFEELGKKAQRSKYNFIFDEVYIFLDFKPVLEYESGQVHIRAECMITNHPATVSSEQVEHFGRWIDRRMREFGVIRAISAVLDPIDNECLLPGEARAKRKALLNHAKAIQEQLAKQK